MQGILEEDSHPARRIRISYTINHLGQFQIQVLSIPALELKEEIHKAINTIPREERFELVKTTLSRNDWDKYGLDNENCFIVFPIYPPRYGNTESLLKEEQDWINEVQVHGCRCDETTPVNNFLVNWPKEGGRICPLNVIYTPFEREKASITARTRKTSKPFNKTNIDILNYVQRTRQRIVDVPIIDNGGETSPVYVRDVWVDYADGIIRRFILSEGAVCIDPPVPRAYPQPRPQDLFDMITDATNENCFIVFPIYPPRYGNTESLLKEEQDWINEVQVHGCRCDETTPVNNFLVNWPKEGGRICPLNVIYTPFEREKASITARTRKTSKPFNKTNIDILNYVQRTRQRIVDVPIIDNGGETSPVYVRDVWVDYADGIIRRFILSEGAVCIDPPVPRAYPQPRPQDLFDMITDATNENCFIVFPIYPPRYEEIDKLPSS
ncbi:hypothetical protein BLNAU_23954 [Blattamonas nauphoetae]|uniref:Uncharacterized protein n=1 Tax=Blattamonas nauphoetae TaxID=2049346 RepID=A0ABQ9WP52_9EUKA|nr:hypothetical protein BLNAU_23950 [Blattamonas nauphoetae]KAK2941132.1 hypothetical protein BLNAU_23954 [Blattamonas nauphoetae]